MQTSNQFGATLAVTLVLLLIVSVLGISAVQTSLVEEKMSGNLRDKHIAFEAAETGIIAAEDWLENTLDYPTPTTTGTEGVWVYGFSGSPEWWRNNSDSWWGNNAVSAAGNSLQSAAPQYFIEDRSASQAGEDLTYGGGDLLQVKFYYQITARGYGGNSDTRVHLRTTYIKRFD